MKIECTAEELLKIVKQTDSVEIKLVKTITEEKNRITTAIKTEPTEGNSIGSKILQNTDEIIVNP